MEDIRRDPSSDFDSEYIDQLFSAGRTPAKQEVPSAPAPQPEPEPEPVAAEIPATAEPADKPFPRALLILLAIALLGVGFLLGWLARGDQEMPGETSVTTTQPTYTWIDIDTVPSTDSGIAVDYAAMSTMELVNRAVQIPGLAIFGNHTANTIMPMETYSMLKRTNPVLVELQQRPDAVEQLASYAMRISYTDYIHAANALISYYVTSLGFPHADSIVYDASNSWIREISDVYTVYEHTKSPMITYTNIYGGSISGPCTIFDFEGDMYTLSGQNELPDGTPNFWYRIELKQNAEQILAAEPRPALAIQLSSLQANGDWALIQPYEGGWFVYGHANDNISVSFAFHPNPGENASYRVSLPVYPQPGENATAMEIAEYVLQRGQEILALQQIYGNLHYDQYPPLKRLLETEGGLAALLNLTQSKFDDFSNLSSVRPPYMTAVDILSLTAVTHHMNDAELSAFNRLEFRSGYFSIGSMHVVPIQGPNSDIDPRWNLGNYRVGDTPETLGGMDVNELNYWSYVSMRTGSRILYQENWTLEATLEDGSGVLGVWDVYDSNTGELVGWIVSGQFDSPQTVYLQLKQGDLLLETQKHVSQLLS